MNSMIFFAAIAALSLFLSLIVLGIFIIYWQRANIEYAKIDSEIERLKKENKTIVTGAVGVGERLLKFEKLLQTLIWRQDTVELRDCGLTTYTHATKLAEKGSSTSELIDTCGLSRAEAELIKMLNEHKIPVIDNDNLAS